VMKKRHLPLLGLALSLPLFWLAIANYPGGNDWDTAAAGFSFTENYVSALFQPKAINGTPNSARVFAIPAMLIFCTCISFLFWAISKHTQHRVTGKVIQIFGIGSMVYTFLGVCTVMHDLLVLIAAAFFVIAVIGMLFMSHTLRRPGSMLGGLFCLAFLIALGVMRHGNVRLDLAPITEWLLFALSTAWLTFAYYTATTSNNSFKPNLLRSTNNVAD